MTPRPGKAWLSILALALASLTGCDGGATTTPGAPAIVAPYVTADPRGASAAAAALAGAPVRRFVLAFALAQDGRCAPAWNGDTPPGAGPAADIVRAVTAAGGSVAVASGGASGTYLENTCATATDLATAYRTVLASAHADTLDLDVETRVPVDLVADAVSTIQHELGIRVVVTAEVADDRRGLDANGLDMVRALAARGIEPTVNAMVMNFPATRDWSSALTAAADTVTGQLARIWPAGGLDAAYRRLGLTFMAGRNDTGPITTLADAGTLRDYADAHRIAFFGFWSLARDNGGCPGAATARADCSGVAQAPLDFTRALISRP
ncbi:carbohydrate-binding protein CenC [Amycolatopsis sp. K13G38]|uniref:Carbohydrate-binding protein CenC n=1 Tax=Amycolatopsis acididurans TaxID=2724524 RepID=A0ABX1JI33_9PSEU|nr:carbohydrate-binding protein CenC [Amycolatopsis acididurans]NKQ58886.1 carbohydrate-binding protein CenC [Amycolatopsis acididurans]